MNKMVQMEEHMELHEKKIEIFKGESSSSHVITSTDPTDGLSKSLENLNLKGDKIEKLKKTVATQGEKIKDKDKIIVEYEKLKAKLLIKIEQLEKKLSRKSYLVEARHII